MELDVFTSGFTYGSLDRPYDRRLWCSVDRLSINIWRHIFIGIFSSGPSTKPSISSICQHMERMFDDMEKHPEDSRNNWEMDCESSLCNSSQLADK